MKVYKVLKKRLATATIDMRALNNSKIPHSPASFLIVAACLSALLFTGCQPNPPRENTVLVMQHRVAFPEMELVDKQLMKQCDITTHLSDDIQYYAKPYFSRIDLVDTVSASTPGKTLFVKVVNFRGNGRSMVVEGVLREHGVVIGNFVTQDTFWRSASPCMALAGISRVLGKRIGKWLADPTRDARLGPVK